MDGVGTADWRTRRDGATGLPLFWTSPKERSRETPDAAGLWKGRCLDGGWASDGRMWRDGATDGFLKVVIFKEI